MTKEFNIKDWTKWELVKDDNGNLLAPCQICRWKIREHMVLQYNLIRCMGCGVKKGI